MRREPLVTGNGTRNGCRPSEHRGLQQHAGEKAARGSRILAREVRPQRLAAGRLVTAARLLPKFLRTLFPDKLRERLAAGQQSIERETWSGGLLRRQRTRQPPLQRRDFGVEEQRFAGGRVAAGKQTRSRGPRNG